MKKFFLTQEDKNLLNSKDNQVFNNKNLKYFAIDVCENDQNLTGGFGRFFGQFRKRW